MHFSAPVNYTTKLPEGLLSTHIGIEAEPGIVMAYKLI